MSDVLTSFVAEFHGNSVMELVAVLLAVVYLLLAVRQNIACWYAAFISTAIFLHVFWSVQLYMESGLQVFYLVMAVYGWMVWREGSDHGQRPIVTWRVHHHLLAAAAVAALTLVSGTLLEGTDQRLGYLDSFTTWGAILTTFMVAHKVLENWLYWLVIDSASIYLYLDRDLYFTALLFAVYLVIVVYGYWQWRRDFRGQQASAAPA